MTVLLLAGTGEARGLAPRLAGRAIASLAGATRTPADLELPTRVGGFGGVAGLCAYIAETGITRIIDATHPFAAQMTDHAAQAARATGTPLLILRRPGWRAGPGDRWHWVDDLGRVGALTGPDATLFLATGRQSLAAFSALPNQLWCRVIDPPGGPFPGRGGWIEGRPPFSVADEIALFQRLGIDWLVTKNSGGEAPVSKLVAARDLGLPVVIQRRPPLPPGITRVRTPEEALAWLDPA